MESLQTYKYLVVLLVSLLFISCNKEDESMPNINVTKQKEALCDVSSPVYMCTEYPIEVSDQQTQLRAAVFKSKKWGQQSTIKIKFLNGSEYLHNKVKLYASRWIEYANLNFVYVEPNDNADIKVAFKWDCDYSSWSYLGTDCKRIAQHKPSMNFGWFNNYTSEMEFERVILHEFGHALGLIHEHQHPLSNIQWDKQAVYEYYGAMDGWDEKSVDHNIFKKYSKSQTNYSAFDSESIMLYAISDQLTLNGFSVDWNYTLSETDKKFIAQMYP